MSNSDKTCQTCKHWDVDIERKTEYFSMSMEKCKEIHKSIDIPNNVQWRKHEWIHTKATFGCNGYEKTTN